MRKMWSDDDGGAHRSDPKTWGPWVHRGHRLWAAMSDAFWVYVFKVQRCRQLSNHDWTACPYAHKGERARRRDPRRYPYLAVPCSEYRASHQHHHQSGRTGAGAAPSCVRGLRCRHAHGVFELWLHPAKFRTAMCEGGPGCQRRVCFFAHSPAELRGENDPVTLVGMPPPPPPRILRSPAHLSLPRRVGLNNMQAVAGKLRLLYGGAGASSPSSSPVAVSVARAAPVPALQQASPDDENDPESGPTSASEDGSMAGDYPHFDLIKDMII